MNSKKKYFQGFIQDLLLQILQCFLQSSASEAFIHLKKPYFFKSEQIKPRKFKKFLLLPHYDLINICIFVISWYLGIHNSCQLTLLEFQMHPGTRGTKKVQVRLILCSLNLLSNAVQANPPSRSPFLTRIWLPPYHFIFFVYFKLHFSLLDKRFS